MLIFIKKFFNVNNLFIFAYIIKQLKTKIMTQKEIIDRLENITWLMAEIENTYVKHELEEITEALKTEFNYSDTYEQEVKDVLKYYETIYNLNNIKIR